MSANSGLVERIVFIAIVAQMTVRHQFDNAWGWGMMI